MNNKITFPRLASLLADKSGRSKRFSEDFLREFFTLISERLVAGDSVKIKGLGTFKLSKVEARKSVDVTTGESMEISGHSKVVFLPSKDLAAAVNSPFEAFTAIEISDDADISQLFNEANLDEHTYNEDVSDQEISINEYSVEENRDTPTDGHVIDFIEESEEEVITKPDIVQPSKDINTVVSNLEDDAILEETSEIIGIEETEDSFEIAGVEETED
ncbi:MAG: HU family DNA-binding protein, partial [Muribaculaceae bacterium]|nr:HU family DNA-binding protein [Muribaculaceae bacterium]